MAESAGAEEAQVWKVTRPSQILLRFGCRAAAFCLRGNRRRIRGGNTSILTARRDQFDNAQGKASVLRDHLGPGDEGVVDQHVERLVGQAVERHYAVVRKSQPFAHRQTDAAQFDTDPYIDIYRTSFVSGKSVSVRVDLGGCRFILK